MVFIRAKKPTIVKNKEFRYDFSEDLIQDIDNLEHIEILIKTNKFTLIL